MNSGSKMIGAAGCQIVVGAAATPVKTGFKAFGCTVRVDGTKIMSVINNSGTNEAAATVANESWENVDLIAGEEIPFGDPITSITLNAAADSILLWLEPK